VSVYREREYEVNQGDLFAEVPFPVEMPGGPYMGMVISHDCDVDKFLRPDRPLSEPVRQAFRVTMAIAHPVDDLAGGRANHVRDDKMPRYFYLPAEGEFPDLCVDLWTEQPVRMLEVLACERVASLSTESKERLWWKIIRLRLGRHFQSILQGEIPPDAA
jgi:hypothetical protein